MTKQLSLQLELSKQYELAQKRKGKLNALGLFLP